MLILQQAECTSCHTKQYFGTLQPYGTLNRRWSMRRAYRQAINNLWFCNQGFEKALCPACVAKQKPRKLPVIKVEYTQLPDRNSWYWAAESAAPIMALLWRTRVNIENIQLHDNNTVLLGDGRNKFYSISRSELIDPMIFDLFTTTKKPDYVAAIRAVLDDRLDYCRHYIERPLVHPREISVILDPDSERALNKEGE